MSDVSPVSAEHSETRPPIVPIDQIARWEGRQVTIRGWLYNLRASGKILFPIFRDGTGLLQGVIAKNAVAPEVFEQAKALTHESSLIATGTVRADQRAHGGYELDVSGLEVLQAVSVDDPFPITPKASSPTERNKRRRSPPPRNTA